MNEKENIITEGIEDVKDFKAQRRELSEVLKVAIGHRSITEFTKDCGMVDAKYIVDILNEKIKVLPERRLFRTIEKASERRVTYAHLCHICGYSEYDCDDNWMNFYPDRGSVYMVDLGFSNLDSEQNGIRPCLVIQNNMGNKYSGTISVAPITCQSKKQIPTHVRISRREGMSRDSIICIEQTRVVSKRRLFYNNAPIKVLDLSDDKIFEVNAAIEKEFGLIGVMYDPDHAFELVEQIEILKHNIKAKQSKDLISVLEDKMHELVTYCKKYRKNHELVINEYERSSACAI